MSNATKAQTRKGPVRASVVVTFQRPNLFGGRNAELGRRLRRLLGNLGHLSWNLGLGTDEALLVGGFLVRLVGHFFPQENSRRFGRAVGHIPGRGRQLGGLGGQLKPGARSPGCQDPRRHLGVAPVRLGRQVSHTGSVG